jgi:DNA mismatch endonuclease (patch repair protein)
LIAENQKMSSTSPVAENTPLRMEDCRRGQCRCRGQRSGSIEGLEGNSHGRTGSRAQGANRWTQLTMLCSWREETYCRRMRLPTAKRRGPQKPRKVIRRDRMVVSKYMSSIRSRGTQLEQQLCRILRPLRMRFQTQYQRIPGTPDVAFVRARVAVFIDGCFWHACPRCYVQPSINTGYWAAKAERNRRRDRRTNRQLRALGWSVVRIRECALERNADACVRRIARILERRRAEFFNAK